MPKKIKPKMSRDELINFDWQIEDVSFDLDEAEVKIVCDDGGTTVCFNEKDLEDMLQFIRRNKL